MVGGDASNPSMIRKEMLHFLGKMEWFVIGRNEDAYLAYVQVLQELYVSDT